MNSSEMDSEITCDFLDWSALMMDLHRLHTGMPAAIPAASEASDRIRNPSRETASGPHEFIVRVEDIKRVMQSQIDIFQVIIPNGTHSLVRNKNYYLEQQVEEMKQKNASKATSDAKEYDIYCFT